MGLNFLLAKLCVHFHKKRGTLPDPDLYLYRKKIRVVKETKFLGVTFDQKLSFIPHLKTLKTKCMKALDIIKVVANQEWGADKTVFAEPLSFFNTFKIRLWLYRARPSYLKMLNTVHHQGLRLALGAFRTSPVESLYVEAGELPLEQRRIKLSLQYITKLKSTPSNPAYNCVFDPQYELKYLRNTKTISPLGIRIKPHLEDCDIILDQINDDDIYDIPPWELSSPTVKLKIHSTPKSETLESDYKQRFHAIKDFYESMQFGSVLYRRI